MALSRSPVHNGIFGDESILSLSENRVVEKSVGVQAASVHIEEADRGGRQACFGVVYGWLRRAIDAQGRIGGSWGCEAHNIMKQLSFMILTTENKKRWN